MADITLITDFSSPELDIYARLSERQLLHYYEPEEGIFIAESPKVIERALNAGYEPLSFLVETKHVEGEAADVIGRCGNIPVYTAEFDVLTKLTGFPLTRGVLCAMRRRPLPKAEMLCRGAERVAVLENVMNPANTGSVYRRAARISMGTVFQVPWTFFDEEEESWPEKGMDVLKKMGFQTAAMALCDDSIGIDALELKKAEKLAVVLGTEGDGLASETIADCDYTVRIPMAGGVDSLNVAAASAVAFWELRRPAR